MNFSKRCQLYERKSPRISKINNQLSESIFDAVPSVNLARVTRDDAETPRFISLLRQEDILFITDSERIYDLEVKEYWQAMSSLVSLIIGNMKISKLN